VTLCYRSTLYLCINSETGSFILYFILELEENSTLNDEVWAAVGLQGNGTFPLERSSYNNSALLDVIFRHIRRTNFNGITVSRSEGKMGEEGTRM